MESRERLEKHLKRLRRNEFYSRMVKTVFLIIFVLLMPVLIYEEVITKDLLSVVFLVIAEIILIIVTVVLCKSAIEYAGNNKSRIYKCIENPNVVTEIIVTHEKILFEIKGMEDETLYIKESKYRSLLIKNIIEVFGDDKVIKSY